MEITRKHYLIAAVAFFAAWLAHVLGFLTVLLIYAVKFPVELTLVVAAIVLIVVAGIWLGRLFRPEPGSAVGFFPGIGLFLVTFWEQASWFVSAFLAALVVHTGLAYVFDSTLSVLGGVEVFKDAIMEPGTIPAEFLKELLVLLACYSVFTLWYRSARKHRPNLYRWAIGVSIVLLVAFFAGIDWKQVGEAGENGIVSIKWKQGGEKIASNLYTAWDHYFPQADPKAKAMNHESKQLLASAKEVEEGLENERSAFTIFALAGEHQEVTIPEGWQVKMHTLVVQDQPLKLKDKTHESWTAELTDGKVPSPGSCWMVDPDDVVFHIVTEQYFIRMINCFKENEVRWMRQGPVKDLLFPEDPLDVEQPAVSTATLAVAPDIPDHVRYSQFSTPQEEVFVTVEGYVGTELYIDRGDLVVIRAGNNGLVLDKHLELVRMKLGYAKVSKIGFNFPNDDEFAFGLIRFNKPSPPIMLAADGTITKSSLRFKLSRPIAGEDGLSIMVTIVRQAEVEAYLASLA